VCNQQPAPKQHGPDVDLLPQRRISAVDVPSEEVVPDEYQRRGHQPPSDAVFQQCGVTRIDHFPRRPRQVVGEHSGQMVLVDATTLPLHGMQSQQVVNSPGGIVGGDFSDCDVGPQQLTQSVAR